VSVATETVNMAWDPDVPEANRGGTVLDAITKDHLNTGLTGQIRFRVSEQNLYAYLFGVKRPISHIMGYFVAILRQRIGCFEAPAAAGAAPAPGNEAEAKAELSAGTPRGAPKTEDPARTMATAGVSINDLRKNLRVLNESMEADCQSSSARYGIVMDASLITGIDPPGDVESALAAINTAHNQVSAEVSLAQAAADQRIVQSRRAVEIETLRAQAEVEPLTSQAMQLLDLHQRGANVLDAYVRNVRLSLYSRAKAALLKVTP
jgi:regulator of protease activity HflC (stomatin/prohibitin superfamily)